jgi:hypothetical protein
MDFQIGDKVVLKDKIWAAYMSTTKVKHTNIIKEVISIISSTTIRIRLDEVTIQAANKENYRLATESEIKKAELKNIFSNKPIFRV